MDRRKFIAMSSGLSLAAAGAGRLWGQKAPVAEAAVRCGKVRFWFRTAGADPVGRLRPKRLQAGSLKRTEVAFGVAKVDASGCLVGETLELAGLVVEVVPGSGVVRFA